MTDDERETYQRKVRELAAEYRAQRPASRPRSIMERVAELLRAKKTPPLVIAPKHRLGTQPQLVDDGPGPRDASERGTWHLELPNAELPLHCHACREPMLPGTGLLSEMKGLCGLCSRHGQGNPAPPLVVHDEPPAAA